MSPGSRPSNHCRSTSSRPRVIRRPPSFSADALGTGAAMGTPISPAPVGPDYCAPDGDLLPAYLSNGVVGLRVTGVPWRDGMAVLNGVAGVDPLVEVESVPTVPFPLAGDLSLDHQWMSNSPHRLRPQEQRYDFATGELHSSFSFAVDGTTAHVELVTFCSRSQPAVVAQQALVTVDRDCTVELRATVDPGDVPGRMTHRRTGLPGSDEPLVDGSFRWHPVGDIGSAGFAWYSSIDGADGVQRSVGRESQGPARTTYAFDARAGRRYRLVQLTALVPDTAHSQPDRQAARLAVAANQAGFDRLREDNAREWEELWRGRPVLVGAEERWQASADAAHFYLHTSAHRSSQASTYIFGLAQWHDYHYYYGHVMWDIEAFAVPALQLTQPEAARTLLDYRWRSLPAARLNARANGYAGAQFPWESSARYGEEAAPADAFGALYEQHVSMGVAHAFLQHAHATGDTGFLRDRAWPVLSEVAAWIAGRAEPSERGYELRSVMGIAERERPSDNVAFVAMAADVALRDAIEAAALLGKEPDPQWQRVRDGLVLVTDGHGVVLDHDGYRPDEEKGSTPATMCGLFPLGYELAADSWEATARFYLGMADDYVGQPMLSALYGAWAARLGDRDLSARLFDEGFASFVSPRFHNVHEYRPDKFPDKTVAGPFTANLAGFLVSCLYGLTGIEIGHDADQWCRRPVRMPSSWDAIEVERLWVKGRPMSLQAGHGDDKARLTPL